MIQMPQFLYRLRPNRIGMLTEGPTDRESAVVAEHFAYLQALVSAGTMFLAGRTLEPKEEVFGIVVFVAPSEPAALEIMRNDPAVKQGVMHAELFPFHVALRSAG